MLEYDHIKRLLAGRRLPVAFVDLDAFDRNIERVVAMLAPRRMPLRVASKSVRVVALLRRIQAADPTFVGLMCFSVEEAAHLRAQGFDDLLVAYPAYQNCDLTLAAQLVSGGTNLNLMADCELTVERIAAAGRAHDVAIQVMLCVDMSLELGRARLHLGVRRSPLRTPAEVVSLARFVAGQDGVRFHGVMGYEAQVAGLGDANPFEPLLNTTVLKTFPCLPRRVLWWREVPDGCRRGAPAG